jgi:hypothetical protein
MRTGRNGKQGQINPANELMFRNEIAASGGFLATED